MGRAFLPAFCLLMISNIVISQNDLKVEITGLHNDKGIIMLQLFDEGHNIVSQHKGTIKEKKSVIIIKNLKTSKYAIRYFHDENLNGTMDTNLTGMPTEGYGFSNDAYGMFGPKPFGSWIFEVKENKKIVLKTKY